MQMVTVGDRRINPAYVAHMRWDHRHYVNGSESASALTITMADGLVFSIRHQPQYGSDAYRVEREILAALAPPMPDGEV